MRQRERTQSRKEKLLTKEVQKMKKTLTLVLALLMAVTALVACGNNDTQTADLTGTPEEIIGKIYEVKAPEFMLGSIPVDTSDADAVRAFLGLDSASAIESAFVSEPMIGSQAYSLVIAQVKEGENVQAVADAMKAGINPRKWICVEADDIKVATRGNYICFCMISSDFAPDYTAQMVIDAFNSIK